MKTLKFVFILAPSVACAQVYFPLHVGDWWSYGDFSYVCEGGGTIYRIVGTNVFKGLTYFRFLGASPFSGPFARADSMRVFTYDTTMQTEYTVFDFSARAGDTVSVRNSGSLITIALGSLRFQTYDSVSQHGFIYEVRDSLGVVSMTPNWVPCESELTGAFIDGKMVSLDVEATQSTAPTQFALAQNYPNPFNPTTRIRFYLPLTQTIHLEIYNSLGEQIEVLASGRFTSGWHEVEWNARKFPSSIYHYRLTTPSGVLTRSAILLK